MVVIGPRVLWLIICVIELRQYVLFLDDIATSTGYVNTLATTRLVKKIGATSIVPLVRTTSVNVVTAAANTLYSVWVATGRALVALVNAIF